LSGVFLIIWREWMRKRNLQTNIRMTENEMEQIKKKVLTK
jgi:hypothetical protein